MGPPRTLTTTEIDFILTAEGAAAVTRGGGFYTPLGGDDIGHKVLTGAVLGLQDKEVTRVKSTKPKLQEMPKTLPTGDKDVAGWAIFGQEAWQEALEMLEEAQ